MRDHNYYVYILTNKRCTTLYVGVTKDLSRRLYQHRFGEMDGFAKRYQLNRLVWFAHFQDVTDAIACEKRLKGWRRSRKIALIEQNNPRWMDLSENWGQHARINRAWNTEEMVSDSSVRAGLASAQNDTLQD